MVQKETGIKHNIQQIQKQLKVVKCDILFNNNYYSIILFIGIYLLNY